MNITQETTPTTLVKLQRSPSSPFLYNSDSKEEISFNKIKSEKYISADGDIILEVRLLLL